MIVECPRCNARYRVEEEVLRDEPTFKCSRCSHIFAYEGEAPAPVAPESELAAGEEPAPASESLSFDFRDTPTADEEPAANEEPGGEDDPGDAPAREDDGDDGFVFDGVGPSAGGLDEEAPEEEEDEDDDRLDEPRFVRGEDELRVEEIPAGRPVRSYLIFLTLLALLYANLALYLRNNPAEAGQMLASIPVAGRFLTEDRLLQSRIHLDEVEGVYQTIKDDRRVFIVSGRAVNTSQQPLKGVQIESTLYGPAGDPIETKSIYCGNAMSLKIVRDLSSKEISLLQRLEPPQRFEIQPGESAGFTVVFMNPPQGLKEFSARVVAAHRVIS